MEPRIQNRHVITANIIQQRNPKPFHKIKPDAHNWKEARGRNVKAMCTSIHSSAKQLQKHPDKKQDTALCLHTS
jgi:hypothetical protein